MFVDLSVSFHQYQSLILPVDIVALERSTVGKVFVDCVAQDGTTVLGNPLSFYLWSAAVELRLSRTTLRSAGGFTCPFPPYQTAQIDVPATFRNPDTTPTQIQANIYSLVKDKVCTYVVVCTYVEHMYGLIVLCVCVCYVCTVGIV